ncbi:helix-turn-helix domain-containing protein [Gordonia alkaliphila]|uniref:helix-turn-helix domain-containing protein n=1 Tax=Gordonia alkaliphila TaxID=1053547 RepID=UPI001FF2CDA1|nr:helix-turn-helix domain-containing protein [Gordonia alkaliphila]MCK0441143.1 helix-turn-helix domain-containing protein [Gordonia alkaliphila]
METASPASLKSVTNPSQGAARPNPAPAQIPVEVRRQRVADLTRQGLTVAEIALRLGCGKGTVSRDRKELNRKVAGLPTSTQIRLIRELLATEIPVADIARQVGVSPNQIQSRFPEYKPRPYTLEEKNLLLDEFEWLLGGGEYAERAASRLGMTLAAICQWYRRMARPMPRNISTLAREQLAV